MKKSNFMKKFLAIVLLSVVFGVPVYAVSTGDVLSKPEDGWKSISFYNKENYSGDIANNGNKGIYIHPSRALPSTAAHNKKFHFKFKGTELRIVAGTHLYYADNNLITIDGNTSTFSCHTDDGVSRHSILIFEKTGLEDKIHEVTITSGTGKVQQYELERIDINADGQLLPFKTSIHPLILNINPEKSTIKLNEILTANLEIDNIKNIAAEDILINYDQTKLEYVGMEEIPGIKTVHFNDDKAKGQLRLILASQGEANIVNAKKILLKLKFKGIHVGDGLIDITKAKVADGITLEKELLAKNCGDATITIVAPKDVNRSGEYTLLDLSIDARHFGKDPKSAELSSYDTDVVVNNAIDNADLLKIAQEMLTNSNYVFKN